MTICYHMEITSWLGGGQNNLQLNQTEPLKKTRPLKKSYIRILTQFDLPNLQPPAKFHTT